MLTPNELQFIKDTQLYRLATSTPTGRPHVIPMFTRMDGDNIVVGGYDFDISYKRRLIDRNQWIACVWDTRDEAGAIKGVEIRGKAVATGKIWDGSEYFILEPTKVFSWGIDEPASESFAKKMNFDVTHLAERGT
jgi:hypothetical protein